eukprot:6075432-Prymnesium_polylepis.1
MRRRSSTRGLQAGRSFGEGYDTCPFASLAPKAVRRCTPVPAVPSSMAPLVEHYACLGAGAELELAGAPPAEVATAASSGATVGGWERHTYKASMLTEFPPSRPLSSKVALEGFCLPSGLRLSTERRPPAFACFVLTLKDGERLYGHCLT